jgi:FKBP-type peptidyl-prolyl cis-trans isomerase FklB
MRKVSNLTIHFFMAGALMTSAALAQNSSTSSQQSSQSAPATQSAPAANTQQAAPPATPNIPGLPTKKDQVSYAIGMNIGKGLHRDAIDVDPNFILQGLKDGMADGKMLMTDEQAQQSLMALQAEVRAQQETKRKQEAVDNQKAGEAFLAANKSKPGVVTTADGLQYKIITQGTGAKPTLDDVVTVNYKGSLINGKEFDSSYKRGEPATFPVRGVIKGWTEALQLVPVGTKFELWLPPDLAYGEHGAGQDIGPNETLVFEVEVISVKPQEKPKTPAESTQPKTPASTQPSEPAHQH